jgi:cytidylate kinase
LGYECLARDVLIEASKEFNVDEVKLVRAISDASSFFERISYGKQHYISYIRAALLSHLKRDNIVYHGMAGHFFVRDISHVLKVRVIADMEDRIRLLMARDRISRKAAERFIHRIDRERRKWGQQMYGIDTTEARLYDMVLSLHKFTVEDAVDIICHTAQSDRLQATDESRRAIEDAALAAAVQVALFKEHPEVEVVSRDGVVFVTAKTAEAEELRLTKKIEKIALGVPGVKKVEVELHWLVPFET